MKTKIISLVLLGLMLLSGQAQSNLVVFTFSGTPGTAGNADGVGTNAGFSFPCGIAMDQSGTLYLGDSGNHVIRKISPAGVVTTLAGSAGKSGTNDGVGNLARFNSPQAVAIINASNLYVADAGNNAVRKLTASGTNWIVSTLAGLPGTSGSANGTGNVARFNSLRCLALATNGDIYVADANNHTIRKVTAAGVVSTVAGLAGTLGSANGTGSAARFNSPRYVAVDDATNVYVADWANFTVRKITSAGMVTTLAGLAGSAGNADGTGGAARFNAPRGVALDRAGNVYVADFFNCTIRKITPAGAVTTLAGKLGVAGSTDGAYTNAILNQPFVVLPDAAGRTLYVVDNNNHTIRKAIYDNGQPFAAVEPRGITVLIETNLTLATTISNSFSAGSQWLFNGTVLAAATNASLVLTNLQFASAGDYGLVVTNASGASTNPIATLTVVPLIISPQPQNVSGKPGTNLSFAVGVISPAPVTYQWQCNAQSLPDATNASVVIMNIQPTNAGFYQVIASNYYGAVKSSTASLSVLGVPVLFAPNGNGIQYANGQAILQLTGLTGQGQVVLQTSTNLTDWSPILTNPPGFGQIQMIDSGAGAYSRRFYRATTPSAP